MLSGLPFSNLLYFAVILINCFFLYYYYLSILALSGFSLPVYVLQCDAFNQGHLRTFSQSETAPYYKQRIGCVDLIGNCPIFRLVNFDPKCFCHLEWCVAYTYPSFLCSCHMLFIKKLLIYWRAGYTNCLVRGIKVLCIYGQKSSLVTRQFHWSISLFPQLEVIILDLGTENSFFKKTRICL